MKSITQTIADLNRLADAYFRRAHTDGPGASNYDYNLAQGARFRNAAEFIRAALDASIERLP